MNTMKKALPVLAAVSLLSACAPKAVSPKMLVLYYSQTGDTEAVAREISTRLGADLEAIRLVEPYSGTFQETVDRGLRETRSGALPALHDIQADLSAYDVIFLGYPIWFGNCAVPILSLLEREDFAGKKVVPFCTFGSGGLVHSAAFLSEKLPQAEILPGYGVRAARLEAMPSELDAFLKESGFLEGEFTPKEPFGPSHAVSPEESAIFDEAVSGYERIHAKAQQVASRPVPGGMEYLFEALDVPRDAGPDRGALMHVYVLAEDGKAPVFTQVVF